MSSGYFYDVAQVCPNGHVATSRVNTRPENQKPFCAKCGEATLKTCPGCQAPIQGRYCTPPYPNPPYVLPAFCMKCGRAFPWTERRAQAAIDLFLDESMSQEDEELFKTSIADISKDTPQAQVAARRITRLLGKISKEAAGFVRQLVVDIASETARKALLP